MITVSVIKVSPLPDSTNSLRAFADVRITTEAGSIRINGISIVESKQGGYFVSLPQRKDKNNDRWFSIVEAEGKLRDQIREAIMEAYKNG